MSNLSDVLDTVGSMANVIKTVAQMPGVNMLPYANTIAGAIELLQVAVTAGKNLTPYVDAIRGTFGDGATVPSEADMAALDAKIMTLRAKLHAPLPPKDEDEPD
jgi:hypothetical protein